ncbi:metalloregulator ArsR/SmtB family transcription factor [Phaeovulum sp. NW3]|uniref:ArsR/SmtB family transcription factor n=1 Tax=Phaeovulum sp. NW3 TaxID=2934933 RepID=UPI00201FEEE2|nr:metalloregulator ArsR/SmtB family transcription factor [Phaeovulum sp. NW3]MCL7466773.1 metalloregulator ArsR/SmtB family transcription factor [Phaeovulum sp. NW3]
MPELDENLATLSRALGHPARIRIVRLLLATPGCIGGDIVGAVGLAQSTVSEHLRILKAAGIISGEIDGPRVCYALTSDGLEPLAEFISSLAPPLGDACCVPAQKETT